MTPSVTLWVLACLVFFVPLAAVLAELSSRHPEQGGISAWARRAFGPAHGFVCGWLRLAIGGGLYWFARRPTPVES